MLDQIRNALLASGTRPLFVGVDGVDTSGKTTLADELVESFDDRGPGSSAIRSSIDGFHHPRARRHRRGRESGEGYYQDTFDYAALSAELLEPLSAPAPATYRVETFDLAADAVIDSEPADVPDRPILVLDGVFLQRSELRRYWTLVVYLHCSFDEVIRRARVRDVANFRDADHVERIYRRRYIPGQQLYIRECAPALGAHIVIDNTDFAAPLVVTDPDARAALHESALAFRP